MVETAGIKHEQPLTSLAGVARGATELWVDGTAKDLAALRDFTALESLRIYRLPRRNVPVLAGCALPRLTVLSVRHADAGDLGFLSGFATLDTLTVWQSPKVMRLDGIERLTRLRKLELAQARQVAERPEIALGDLRRHQVELLEPGQRPQRRQRREPLGVPDAAGERQRPQPAELARVAAAHPFWLRWLLDLSDFDKFAGSSGCKKCGTHRKVLFLRRKKLLWCPRCEGAKLAALLADFERLVEEKRRERAHGGG